MRTTRLVMLAPFRGRRRTRDRRWPPSPGRPTVVSPSATRPAIAKVIASRWSSRLSVAAPRRRLPPSMTRSSPSTLDARAQRAAARPRCRRSGPIPCGGARPRPRMSVVPVGRGGREARAPGSRRSRPRRRPARGRSRGGSMNARPGRRAARRPRRPAVARRSLVDVRAHRAQQVDDRPARRVDADVVEVSSASGWIAPATSQNAAAETSPGTRSSIACTLVPPCTDQVTAPSRRPALHGHAAGPQHPLRVVARRDRFADRRPSVRPQPASRIADFTWALGTGGGVVDGRERRRPVTVRGAGNRAVGRGGPPPSSAAAR